MHLAFAAFLVGLAIGVSRIHVAVLVICMPVLAAVAAVLAHDTLFNFALAAGGSIVGLQLGFMAAVLILWLLG